MPDIHILVVDDFLAWQRFVIELFETETDLKIIAIASDGHVDEIRHLFPSRSRPT